MSEESLMKEIMARGPVLYDFMAGYEFMMYSSGILEESSLPYGVDALTDQNTINSKTQE